MNLPGVLADNIACVQQAIDLLNRLDEAMYNVRHRAFFDAAIGGHIRHNIDHYDNFFRGLPTGRVDYENRQRDAQIETDPVAASAALQSIAGSLADLAPDDLDASCSVRVNTDSDDASDPDHWSGSTVRRELQFLLGHAIHHYAQVAAMCRSIGIEPAAEFGMAPSTIRYRAQLACEPAAAPVEADLTRPATAAPKAAECAP